MTTEITSITNDIDEKIISAPFPKAGWERVLYGFYVSSLPIVAFLGNQINKPQWQSGEPSDYINLLLSPEASLLFFLLLAYSVISYILLLASPLDEAQSFFIRLGIYSGTLLAFQYTILTFLLLKLQSGMAIFIPFVTIAGISPLVFSRFYPWRVKNWSLKFLGIFFACTIALLYLISILISRELWITLILFVIALILASPVWCLLISMRTTVWLIKNFEAKFTPLEGFSFFGWFAVYIAAWRFDIWNMYKLYSALPTQAPNCYIATAAAKGHPSFVRSRLIVLSNGKQMWVNSQLKHFKFAELTLQVTVPRFHKLLRRVYDVIGKALSHKIQHPLLADIAYLLLKPFELISIKILGLFIPNAEHMASKIYDDHQNKLGVSHGN